jgi:hypothetical protein
VSLSPPPCSHHGPDKKALTQKGTQQPHSLGKGLPSLCQGWPIGSPEFSGNKDEFVSCQAQARREAGEDHCPSGHQWGKGSERLGFPSRRPLLEWDTTHLPRGVTSQ